MSKAKFKEKQKKLREQRVRPTEGTEVVSAWDYDFSGANEVHQSDDFEPLESVALSIPEGKPKNREKFKKKRDKARHKLDVSVSPEMASDYLASLNARDAVPPTVLVRDDIPDNVQESTLSKPASRPIFEPAIKKTSKTLSIVEIAGELKKDVHIISYGNTLYYYNKYYYTQLDGKIITDRSKSSFDIWDGFNPIRQIGFSLSRASGHFVSCFVSGKKVQ